MKDDMFVRKAPLPWLLAGLFLGLVQILAIWVQKPLGVSTQFVVVESVAIHKLAPEYAADHSLIEGEKYRGLGYGFWVAVGLCAGAFFASLVSLRWRLQATTVWWRTNHGHSIGARFLAGLVGGFLILMGARFAHGCTSGQFMSGWAQLSLSVVPFTVAMFGAGMVTAYFVYPRAPRVEV